MKNSIAKQVRNKAILMIALILVLGGAGAVVGSFVGQTMEEQTDMQEYAQLLEQAQIPAEMQKPMQEEEKPDETPSPTEVPEQSAVEDEDVRNDDAPTDEQKSVDVSDDTDITPNASPDIPMETTVPENTPTSVPSEGNPQASAQRVNLSALKEQNSDFVAWLRIPGTGIDYPVVWSDDTDYYLNHTFTGKESSVGTLISQRKTDYATPSQNIAIYGHHLRTNNMFTPLLSYKKKSFWQGHDTVELDTLYGSGTYRIFAVLNMNIRDWEPSAQEFSDDASFMAFVNRAKTESFYGTGVEVSSSDEILTLITCDRSYAGADGRLVVMAVKTD